jgi:predicted phosphodiesterase
MRGQFSHNLDEKLLDKEQSYQWLKFGDIKEERDSFCTFTLLNKQKASKRQTNDVHTHTHTHAHTICEHEDMTVLWNPGVHTEREIMANRPDIIKTRKRKHAY